MNNLMLNTIPLDGNLTIKKSDGKDTTPIIPRWTGHADAEGLKAIGWTDEDIAYYQANGVNWNEEDDQYHLVSDDNKALYGVLTADNISTYKDRIVYLPKIDTSSVTSIIVLIFISIRCSIAKLVFQILWDMRKDLPEVLPNIFYREHLMTESYQSNAVSFLYLQQRRR